MTEVIVQSGRKTIFIKSQISAAYLILLIGASSISSSEASSPLISLSLPLFSNGKASDAASSSFAPSAPKFSSVLLSKSPLRIPISDLNLQPAVVDSNPNKESATDVHSEVSGNSLWGVIGKSFFKNKAPAPTVSSRNSVFSSPSLKSPRQAWEDLLDNAKSGFRKSYSPFQATPTTTEAPTTKPSVLSESESGERSPRGSAWQVDTPTLAWDTMKVLWDVNKDLLSHVWKTNVVLPSHPVIDPIKSIFYKPVDEALRFKTEKAAIYKEKLRDIAFLSFLHKDKKVNTLRSSLNPISGWLKPALVGDGWGQQSPVVAQPIIIQSDDYLFKRWVKLSLNVKKYIFLVNWRLTEDIIFALPYIAKVKIHLLKAIWILLAHKDYHAIYKILHILHKATWKGKEGFFDVFLKYNPFLYGLHLPYGPHVPYGPHLPHAPYGPSPQPSSASYPPLGPDHHDDLNLNLYSAPHVNAHQPQSDISQQYETPTAPVVSKNPLYSYPSSAYSSPGEGGPQSQYSYPTLPPVVTNYHGAVKGSWDSFGSGSEESSRHQGKFVSKLVESFNTSNKDKRAEGTSEDEKGSGVARFSLKLLGSRFSSR